MEHAQIKIFVHEDVPRVRYIMNIIFNSILGLDYEVITDRRKIGKTPAVNYSGEIIPGCFNIAPHSILFEKDVIQHKIEMFDWKGLPAFFASSPDSEIPFDIFAASFYLVTRYEEYLDNDPDEHGRFREENSVAYKYGFLQRPVIDLWTRELSLLLLQKFHGLAFRRNEFKALLTLDIDQAFAFKGKGIVRITGGAIKNLFRNNNYASRRMIAVAGNETDPYDVFDYITDSIDKRNQYSIFFFPTGDLSAFDKNPDYRSQPYATLIKNLSGKFRVGIHPSYRSAEQPSLLAKELKRLEKTTGKEIAVSRQHYLKIKFPDSFRNLLKNNICEDYSLGYVREPGFRASIARPFKFFDLLTNEETTLTLVPFQIMDGALQHKSPENNGAIEIVENIINETRKAGGLFVTIWHNTSLTEKGEWIGWRDVFEFILKQQNQ